MDSINIVPYIENEKLGDYARSCARLLKSVGYGGGSQAAAQLRACRRRLRRFRDVLQQRFSCWPGWTRTKPRCSASAICSPPPSPRSCRLRPPVNGCSTTGT